MRRAQSERTKTIFSTSVCECILKQVLTYLLQPAKGKICLISHVITTWVRVPKFLVGCILSFTCMWCFCTRFCTSYLCFSNRQNSVHFHNCNLQASKAVTEFDLVFEASAWLKLKLRVKLVCVNTHKLKTRRRLCLKNSSFVEL